VDNKVNYTVVGIFVVILGLFFVLASFWLSTIKHDKVYHDYLIYVHDDVTGLSVHSPVRYNGVKVGFVDIIELDPKNPQLVRLLVQIEAGTPVTKSTVATLMPLGITGLIYVGLKAETELSPILVAKAGEKLPIIPSKPSLLMQLGEVLPEVTKNIKSIGNS